MQTLAGANTIVARSATVVAAAGTGSSSAGLLSRVRWGLAKALVSEQQVLENAKPLINELIRQKQAEVSSREEEKHKKLIQELMRKEEKMRIEFKDIQSRIEAETVEKERLLVANQALQAVRDELLQRATVHPLYGQLVFQHGLRKVYATSPVKLCNKELFPTYLSQRTFRPERCDAIAESVRKDDRFNGFPGVISLFELTGEAAEATRGNQVRGVVDGQHRIGAIERLLQTKHWPHDRLLNVEVFSISDPADAAKLFMQINKSQPVLDIDLVPIQAIISESTVQNNSTAITDSPTLKIENSRAKENVLVKENIDSVVERLVSSYPKMFSVSTKCKPPNVNADLLRDQLFSSSEARPFALKGTNELLSFIQQKNASLKKSIVPKSKNQVVTAGVEKAIANDFFLGLDRDWC